MMIREDLIYTAGLFDGDGYVGIHISKPSVRGRTINPSYNLSVVITNTNNEIISWLKEIFGGSIRCNHPAIEHHQKCVAWYLSTNKALSFLQAIQPFVKIKKEQVDLAVEYQQMRRHIQKKYGQKRSSSQQTEEELEKYQWCADELKRLKRYENI